MLYPGEPIQVRTLESFRNDPEIEINEGEIFFICKKVHSGKAFTDYSLLGRIGVVASNYELPTVLVDFNGLKFELPRWSVEELPIVKSWKEENILLRKMAFNIDEAVSRINEWRSTFLNRLI